MAFACGPRRSTYSPIEPRLSCGASTTPTISVTLLSCSAATASSMNGCRVLVAERDVVTIAECGGDAVSLRFGDATQRRHAADGVVAAAELVELFLGRRTSSPDVRVVGVEVIGAMRACRTPSPRHRRSRPAHDPFAVHELDDSLEDRRVGLGQDAVTEVEDVAGMAVVVREHLARLRPRRHPTVRSTPPGSRLPCSAQSPPMRARAADSGVRQSTPTTSAPGSRERRRATRRCRRRSGCEARRDPRARRTPSSTQGARTARSATGSALPPSCRTAGRRARRVRSANATT